MGRAQKNLGLTDRTMGHIMAVGAADVLLLSASQIDPAHLFSIGLYQEGNFLWK